MMFTRRRRGRMTAGGLLAVAALTGSLAVASGGDAKAASANLVKNPTFDSGTSYWSSNAATSLSSGVARSGARSVRLSVASTGPATLALLDNPDSVKSTTPGDTYKATAWIRSSVANRTVGLRLMEYSGGIKGEATTNVWLRDTKWTQVSVNYVTKTTGASLDLNALAYSVPKGTYVEVDDVSLINASVPNLPELDPAANARPAPQPVAPVAPTGWKLKWSDEFSGSSVDSTKWNVLNQSTYGDANGELACLMNRPENVNVSGGALNIVSRKEATPVKCGNNDPRFAARQYTSGHLNTLNKFSMTYGRVEIRAQVPTTPGKSKGLWPAMWMRPADGGVGEIDLFEQVGTNQSSISKAGDMSMTIHYDYVKTYPAENGVYRPTSGHQSDGMHLYALEWEPGQLRWYYDGKLVYSRSQTTTKWFNTAFSRPFILRLNTAVGGTWPGAPDASTVFPATYKIDYVRVYQK